MQFLTRDFSKRLVLSGTGGFPFSETISSVLRYSAAGVPPPGVGGSLPESGEWPSPYGVHAPLRLASPPKRRSGVGKYWF